MDIITHIIMNLNMFHTEYYLFKLCNLFNRFFYSKKLFMYYQPSICLKLILITVVCIINFLLSFFHHSFNYLLSYRYYIISLIIFIFIIKNMDKFQKNYNSFNYTIVVLISQFLINYTFCAYQVCGFIYHNLIIIYKYLQKNNNIIYGRT